MSDLFNSVLVTPIASGSNTFSSQIAKKLTGAQKALDKYLAQIAEGQE